MHNRRSDHLSLATVSITLVPDSDVFALAAKRYSKWFHYMSHKVVRNAEIRIVGMEPLFAFLGDFPVGSNRLSVCEWHPRGFFVSLHQFHLCRVILSACFMCKIWRQNTCRISLVISHNVVQMAEICKNESKSLVLGEIVGLPFLAFTRDLQYRK